MSGKTPRRKSFNMLFYSFAGFLFLYSAYLFLSNVDQLFVTETAVQTGGITAVWGEDREVLNKFA